MNNTPEEQQSDRSASSPLSSHWVRRPFQAPLGAPWVPEAFAQLTGLPALPALRGLRKEPDGQWSAEEYHLTGEMPLAQFLTQSAAPVWVFVSIIQQCLAGLMALHQKGLRHGTISSETLLVSSSGHVLLFGCGGGEVWENPARPGTEGGIPPLPTKLAVDDLRGLGQTFRAVLGGDPLQRLTATRLDIAPLVAEWIDWLADPEPGREPTGTVQAAAIFNDIRAGRPGIRPWKHNYELPPQVGDASSTASSSADGAGAPEVKKREKVKHGAGFELKPYVITAAVLIVLLGLGSWLAAHLIKDDEDAGKNDGPHSYITESRKTSVFRLPDETVGMFDFTGGDTEPLEGTGALILDLLAIVGKQGLPPSSPELEDEENLRAVEAALLAKGEKPSPRAGSGYLSAPDIFPAIGQPTAGRTEGNYYLVWRTQNFVMNNEEMRALQSAILRTARYCGVRVMSWSVLPNQAGVVLRVPQRRMIPDDGIERRISILRGEKVAEGVFAKINACLKNGDNAGADKIRRTWTASMGSAAGFYSVLRTVPIVSDEVLAGRPLWQEKPLRFAQLTPKTEELMLAAAALDTAAAKGKLAASPGQWPYSSLTAAMLNYGPAVRAVSVLMQKDPEMDFPVPPREELEKALADYRRQLGDLPAEEVPAAILTDAKIPVKKPAGSAVPVAAQPQGGDQ